MSAVRKRNGVHECTPPSSTDDLQRVVALSLKEVARRTSLSRAHIYSLISEGKFPSPAKAGNRSIWNQREIELWLEARFAERGQQ